MAVLLIAVFATELIADMASSDPHGGCSCGGYCPDGQNQTIISAKFYYNTREHFPGGAHFNSCC
jgi:hypothetical protein